MWISLEDVKHVKSCKSYLENLYGDIRYNQGYKLFKWCKQYLYSDSWSVNKFWVCKKDIAQYKRGMKLMNQKEVNQYQKLGGEVREILCHPEMTRLHMSELTEQIELCSPYQHGFVKDRDIFTLMETASQFSLRKNFQTSVASIDLQNAFGQISENQVYAIFRFIYGLNVKDAEELAKRCCYNGHLFQGNTWAPTLFNIWFVRVFSRIEKFQLNNSNFILLSYADDLTLITLYDSMSRKFLNFIIKIIQQCNFKINKRKTKIVSGKHMEICGLQWKETGQQWKIYPRKTQKLKKLIRMWEYNYNKDPNGTTKRINKAGEPIRLTEMLNGLKEWYSRSTSFQPV